MARRRRGRHCHAYLQPLEHAFVQGGALAREQRQAAPHRHRHGLGHVQQALAAAAADDDDGTSRRGVARWNSGRERWERE